MQDDTQRGDLLLPLQERVAAVKPYWETLSQEERVKLLTVSVDDLHQRAADLAERQRKQAGKDMALSRLGASEAKSSKLRLDGLLHQQLLTNILQTHSLRPRKVYNFCC